MIVDCEKRETLSSSLSCLQRSSHVVADCVAFVASKSAGGKRESRKGGSKQSERELQARTENPGKMVHRTS